jgi:tetratricopeptide (TPR) repeat protein
MMSEQIPLFEDEYVLRNDAVGALIALNLDAALSAFQRYHDLYRDNGDIDRMMAIAAFLRQGMAACPENGPDRPGCLFTFWNSFENSMEAAQAGYSDIICQIRLSFFRFLVKAIEEAPLPDSAYLSHRIPIGYAYLQIGRHDRAIRSLQTCLIAAPDNAAVYGYLGDAYFLLGETDVARQVYLEACLIDPETVDWAHLKDNALRKLLAELAEEEGCGEALSRHWLPSYAYIRGFFRPKQIRLKEEFIAFVDDYLELKKVCVNILSPEQAARLFLKGIVLCDNEPFLRMIKGIDFAEVRREMKKANAPLFATYLRYIERRK